MVQDSEEKLAQLIDLDALDEPALNQDDQVTRLGRFCDAPVWMSATA
jgi:hypothetical protein